MTIKVASIGECMIELSMAPDGRWDLGYAGDTFNTLWALRGLLPRDAGTDYVTAFGDDPFSDAQKNFFAEHRIGIAASPCIAGAKPGLYAITLDGHERSFTYWRNAAAARSLADDPAALGLSLRGRHVIYFSGITLAILSQPARDTLFAAISEAREAGALIAFDPNYREQLWANVGQAQGTINRALSMVDIVLPTFGDEQLLYGDRFLQDTIDRLVGNGVNEIVVKCGPNPAHFLAGDGRGAEPPQIVAAPLDTSGAGDAFNGGYLATRMMGGSPLEAVRRGHSLAAQAIQTRGALVRLQFP